MKQKVHENAFYAGSITRADHGETEEKGFFMHTIEGRSVTSAFIPTPARIMRTLEPDGGLPDASLLESVKEGDYVRIVYSIREEDVAQVDDAQRLAAPDQRHAEHRTRRKSGLIVNFRRKLFCRRGRRDWSSHA